MSDCRFGVSPVNYPDPDTSGILLIIGFRIIVFEEFILDILSQIICIAGLYILVCYIPD